PRLNATTMDSSSITIIWTKGEPAFRKPRAAASGDPGCISVQRDLPRLALACASADAASSMAFLPALGLARMMPASVATRRDVCFWLAILSSFPWSIVRQSVVLSFGLYAAFAAGSAGVGGAGLS